MTYYLQTCRFCRGQDTKGADTMVKYGPRHHAHFACYLDSGKTLSDLSPWQVGTFPYRLIVDHGLEAEASRLTADERREAHEDFLACLANPDAVITRHH